MKIVAIMGQAGSGKDTIINSLTSQYPDTFRKIVSCTTRPPRSYEEDGYDYYFLSLDEFLKRKKQGTMLENTKFNDWFYGAEREYLDSNKVNIGAFNPNGVRQLQLASGIELTTYLLDVSGAARLTRQLSREEKPNADEIVRRYLADKKDFECLNDINYITLSNNTSEEYLRAREIIRKGAMPYEFL